MFLNISLIRQNTEAGQQTQGTVLGAPHQLRLFRRKVIIAQKMQYSVRHDPVQLGRETRAVLDPVGQDSIQAYNDVSRYPTRQPAAGNFV